MNKHKTIVIVVGVAAFLCATCAPVESPEPLPENDPPPGNTPVAGRGPRAAAKRPRPRLPRGPQARIEAALRNVRQREVRTTNGFWTVFHALLGVGPGLVLHNPETKVQVNALDYITSGGEVRGMRFLPTRYGLDVQTGPVGVGQGHQDQFIAEMAQWGMPADRKFVVQGRECRFMDFVEHAKMHVRVSAKQELSWAILVLAHYMKTDMTWTNEANESLHYEQLIRYELDASVENAACGGTHRLFGLAWAYHLHLQRGGRNTGVWKEVAEKTEKYRKLARKYQNPDGTFSTEFFRGPGNAPDRERRINTTGHILEWMALALSDEDLRAPWVQDAASALALLILEEQGSPIEGGSLYHANHGLLMYYARIYGRNDLVPPELLIPRPPTLPAPRTS
jgi:hypothetical protein